MRTLRSRCLVVVDEFTLGTVPQHHPHGRGPGDHRRVQGHSGGSQGAGGRHYQRTLLVKIDQPPLPDIIKLIGVSVVCHISLATTTTPIIFIILFYFRIYYNINNFPLDNIIERHWRSLPVTPNSGSRLNVITIRVM